VRWHRLQLAALLAALLLPASAAAQDDGVFVDPDSPTGKQYAIPLESARRQADPAGDGRLAPPGERPTGTTAAPLFGEGIARARGSASKRSSKEQSSKASRPGQKENANSATEGPLKAAVNNPGAPSGGIGPTLLIAGGGALVLLLGAIVGFLMRRRSST